MHHTDIRTWTGLDGQLVFDFSIAFGSNDDLASSATIYCRGTQSEAKVVSVYESRRTTLNLNFHGIHVSGYLLQNPQVHVDGSSSTGIFADVHFGRESEYHFEGLMVACPNEDPGPGPDPVVPQPAYPPEPLVPSIDDPTEPGSPLPVIGLRGDALFNYMYLRHWPQVTAEAIKYGFISFELGSPPGSAFFNDLVNALQAGRAAVEALALSFINGFAPYQGDFLQRLADLSGPVAAFAQLAVATRGKGAGALDWLRQQLVALAQAHASTSAYFFGGDYREALSRVWDSYFALTITLGYDWVLLRDLGQTLWLAHVIECTMLLDDQGELRVTSLSAEQLAAVFGARVLLPASLFPLPPAQKADSSSPPGGALGWIEPYAIGDLQLVRQRLVRYAPGEIARIENVMRGERRELSRRDLRGHVEVNEVREKDTQLIQNDAADERSSLLEEVRQLVAEKALADKYDNFTTNYGPPTQGTVSGTLTRSTTQGANPGREDKTRFARDVLSKTVNRIQRKVGSYRSTTNMRQVEDVVSSVIDNTQGQSSIRGVFRWLNKVYEASVVNYGNRLMLEFFVQGPAQAYLSQASQLAGSKLTRPVPLAELGLLSFQNVNSHNYALLGARFGVVDLSPPPAPKKLVAVSVRDGEDKQLTVPKGYQARKGFVAAVSLPAGAPAPAVLVGRYVFDSGTQSAPLPAYGEDSIIPVAVISSALTLSPPSEVQVVVNVEIECEPSAETVDAWQIRTFRALVDAYDRQAAAYFDAFALGRGRVGGNRSPLQNRQIEQAALQTACSELLLQRIKSLTGDWQLEDASPPGSLSSVMVNEPRYRQFLSEALEWTEMTYSYHVQPLGPTRLGEAHQPEGAEDPLFTNFLQAEHARVLVPVTPARAVTLLYAFFSGMLWDVDERLAPVLEADVALVNDLEHSRQAKSQEHLVGPKWELVVPTGMQILDDSAVIGGG